MNIVAICRGAPGLGRVAPSLALTRTLAARHDRTTVMFASYEAGVRYLAKLGEQVADLGIPDGLFIDSVAPQALRVLEIIKDTRPDLVLIDGEFYLPLTLAHLSVPVVYLANPHDLGGKPNTFRRVNAQLLQYADAVLVSSLSCSAPALRPGLVPGTPCLEIPALSRDISRACEPCTGSPRVLITTGGGSLHSSQLRTATDNALEEVLSGLDPLAESGQIGTVRVVLGTDATLHGKWHRRQWLDLVTGPVALSDLYPRHDLLITRAGRNTLAEAAYCGIPTLALPVTADPHRAGEQAANAAAVAAHPGIFTLRHWDDPAQLRDTLDRALKVAVRGVRRTGRRGNDSAATFITNLIRGTGPVAQPNRPTRGAHP